MPRPSDKSVLKTLAKRVRKTREELGLSQSELSRRLDLHHTAIAHIEAARRGPSLGKLVALAGELGVTTDFLCGVPSPSDSQEKTK